MRKFYYRQSVIYGWAVYDSVTNTPAYDAVSAVCPWSSAVMLTEAKAALLCSRLNSAVRRGFILP